MQMHANFTVTSHHLFELNSNANNNNNAWDRMYKNNKI